ncbi:MAG TPA: GDP-mannose 4,6-dehydratase, partial [Gammaproteobacteria bacterium]|nr:GDP-mannose 4,6-dehydratase [Gammaproteobacteria bacterium]
MRKVLITGGAGFIGANFTHHWLKTHPADRVVVLDALTYAGSLLNLKEAEGRANFRFVHGDICDEPL